MSASGRKYILWDNDGVYPAGMAKAHSTAMIFLQRLSAPLLLALLTAGCAGSPARSAGQTPLEVYKDAKFSELSLPELCAKKANVLKSLLTTRMQHGAPYSVLGKTAENGRLQIIKAIDLALDLRGKDKRYCEGGTYALNRSTIDAIDGQARSVTSDRENSKSTGRYRQGEHPLYKLYTAIEGWSREDAKEVLGEAISTSSHGPYEVYQYCYTGPKMDGYLDLIFLNDKALKPSVVMENRGLGNCTNLISNPVWPEKTLDEKTQDSTPTDSYVGERLNGLKHGFGTEYYENGSYYTREWSKGHKSGKGTFHFSSGGYYVGEFNESLMSGNGQSFSADGNLRHSGEYLSGFPEGNGTTFNENGSILYSGQHSKGKFHGEGTLWTKDGTKLNGTFANGDVLGKALVISPEGKKYEAQWKDGKIVDGTFRWLE